MNTVGLMCGIVAAVIAVCFLIKADRDIKKRKKNI